VFEDLHWADPTSLDLLEQLMPITERAMLCIIALFRPQRQEPSRIMGMEDRCRRPAGVSTASCDFRTGNIAPAR